MAGSGSDVIVVEGLAVGGDVGALALALSKAAAAWAQVGST